MCPASEGLSITASSRAPPAPAGAPPAREGAARVHSRRGPRGRPEGRPLGVPRGDAGALGVGGLVKYQERFRGKKVVATVCGRNIDLEVFKRIIR